MDNYSAPRYETKIESFDTCMIDVQGRDITAGVVSQSHQGTRCDNDHTDNNEATPIREQDHEQRHTIQIATIQNTMGQNMTLTPIRLPAILDGEFFSVVRVDDTNVTVRCQQCNKLLNGNLKSTGNFLSHIKRVHPTIIDKIKCKSNQRKPAIAYVDMSSEKSPEIIKTKRGYRKCSKQEEEPQVSSEEVFDPNPEMWIETTPNKKRKDESDADMNKYLNSSNTSTIEDEFDAIGKNVAAKLRGMRLDQRIVAEKLINDVLFEAQLCTLHRDSSLQV
ncbi:GSCOCG00002638001-RA-CDS [Cotesia congregata]|uniref:Similar to stil: Protein stand still (Drosophila melanogaster) n=1 Tax=Cotesia congregata TaxID=51543 RepID=A0A8J2HN18_COTCN|nr:GSCOCG00002638001-RA-CDS [Cotesia congregata]CAG5101740.1 Similar to stil: Protein stand still (Drosophila melanogaster) [Cotesia congregata]